MQLGIFDDDLYLVSGDDPDYQGTENLLIILPKEYIIGRVTFCIFPPNQFGKID